MAVKGKKDEVELISSETVMVNIDLIDEPPWNPNEMSSAQFNNLVDGIRKFGFGEPILLGERKDSPGRYWAVSGSHRLKALRVLDRKDVPCWIAKDWDEDQQKFQNMRYNVVKGKISPVKFTAMFQQLAEKYGADVVREMMGFADQAALDQLIVSARNALPDEMKGALDKAKKEIKTIDALAAVLNEMFQKYGSTLDKGYMIFNYGGKSHMWIIMDEPMKKWVDSLKAVVTSTGKNINDVFREQALGIVKEEAQA